MKELTMDDAQECIALLMLCLITTMGRIENKDFSQPSGEENELFEAALTKAENFARAREVQ